MQNYEKIETVNIRVRFELLSINPGANGFIVAISCHLVAYARSALCFLCNSLMFVIIKSR
jgi:hypothetical protein